jgi:hypothetical protein
MYLAARHCNNVRVQEEDVRESGKYEGWTRSFQVYRMISRGPIIEDRGKRED